MSENTTATVLAPQRTGIPLPTPTVLSQPYWDGCAAEELRYQRCTTCGRAEFDPNRLCRGCGAVDLEWQISAGRGTVYSYTEVTRPQTPAFTSPYVVVIVELDEGYNMVSNLIGCTSAEVWIGMPVAVEFHEIGGGGVLPYFAPTAVPNSDREDRNPAG